MTCKASYVGSGTSSSDGQISLIVIYDRHLNSSLKLCINIEYEFINIIEITIKKSILMQSFDIRFYPFKNAVLDCGLIQKFERTIRDWLFRHFDLCTFHLDDDESDSEESDSSGPMARAILCGACSQG